MQFNLGKSNQSTLILQPPNLLVNKFVFLLLLFCFEKQNIILKNGLENLFTSLDMKIWKMIEKEEKNKQTNKCYNCIFQ